MQGLLAISRAIDRISGFVGRSVIWLILLAIIVSAVNAVVRKAFALSSNAWLELQWYLYGAAFMLAASQTLMQNEHVRIDIIYGMWSRKIQHRIDLFGHIFILLPFVLIMDYLLVPYVWRSYSLGEISADAGGLIMWPAKSMLLWGFLLLTLQCVSEIIKKIGVMRGLIEDPHPFVSEHEKAGAGEIEG